MAERTERPHQGDAIWEREARVDRGPRAVVLLGDHYEMDSGRRDRHALLAADNLVHPVHGALIVGERELDAEDCRTRHRGQAVAIQGIYGENFVEVGWHGVRVVGRRIVNPTEVHGW